jgi:hypothetical protein
MDLHRSPAGMLKWATHFCRAVLVLCQFCFAGYAPLIPPLRGAGGCCLARHNFFDGALVSTRKWGAVVEPAHATCTHGRSILIFQIKLFEIQIF